MTEPLKLKIVWGDGEAVRELAKAVVLEQWAKEAVECFVCRRPWTADEIERRGARVAEIEPRQLVCGACWSLWHKVTEPKR